MNDYKNNWFYKICSKQCGKNIGFIVIGVLLLIVGILLFTAVISVLNVCLSLFGVLMAVHGAVSLFSRMPKLGEQMQRMSSDDFASLGSVPPQPYYYDTFYFTERYLCAPSAYVLVRYDRIKDIHATSVRSSGQLSVYVKIEFTDARPSVNVNVKSYGELLKNPNDFTALIMQHKAALAQMQVR